jgi:hypothetical protein
LAPAKKKPCIFINEFYKIFVVFCHRDNKVYTQGFITKFHDIYNLYYFKDIKSFLGIRVIHDQAAKIIWLVYDIYIKKIAKCFKLIDR